MLSAQDNELLTRVGPGTPMGQLMREYWIPAIGSAELEAGAPPVRLMLLCEKLVAFRDLKGRVGVLEHSCPHRCASLYFARAEGDGLRCIYHGWKFDVEGNCLDMPNVPTQYDFSDRIKAKAYRTFEHNGMVFVYMGDRANPPPPPGHEAMFLSAEETSIGFTQRECNWLQGLEGSIDTSHFGFLHLGSVEEKDVDPTNFHRFAVRNRAPAYYMAEMEWGTMYAAHRPADPGELYYRFGHFMFPFWVLIPDGTFDDNINAEAWVPMDDTHVMTTYMFWRKRSPAMRKLGDGSPIPGLELTSTPMLPRTNDWFGRFRSQANSSNDYLIDRDAQKNRSFSGLTGIEVQDHAAVESMGPIVDRSKEHLASSDRMITLTRRTMLRTLRQYMAEKSAPPGVDNPNVFRGARGGSFIGPESEGWLDLYASRVQAAKHAAGTGARLAAE